MTTMIAAAKKPRDDSFLMVNVRSGSSGLPMNIWGRAVGHVMRPGSRCRWIIAGSSISTVLPWLGFDPPDVIEGRLDPADLEAVRRWIALNRDAILDHWAEGTDGVELARALRRLEEPQS